MSDATFKNARVITLSGNEFLRLERMGEITVSTVDPATKDFNFDTFWPDSGAGSGFPCDTLAEIVQTFPMMAERRVIVIREFHRIHIAHRQKIAEIAAGTPETTLLIIEGDEVKLKTKPPKQYLVAENFKKIYENQLPTFIRDRFARRGRKVAGEVVHLLMNNVGDVLGELDNEIEKICTATDVETIDKAAAEKVVGTFKRFTPWALTHAAGLGDFEEATRILARLMEDEPGKATYYLATLFTHIAKIGAYNDQTASGTPHNEALKLLTNMPFLWKMNRLGEQTKRYSPRKVRTALTACAKTEAMLKSSGIETRLLMDIMLPFTMPLSNRKT